MAEYKYRLDANGKVVRVEKKTAAETEREIAAVIEQLREEKEAQLAAERAPLVLAARNEKELEDALQGGPLRAGKTKMEFDGAAFKRARDNGQRLVAQSAIEELAADDGKIRMGRVGSRGVAPGVHEAPMNMGQ